MVHPDTLGGLIIGIPALTIAFFALWRRQRAVFWFSVALILVGVGYLVATGAAADIARLILPAGI
jgi:hypothetical protein